MVPEDIQYSQVDFKIRGEALLILFGAIWIVDKKFRAFDQK